MKKKIRFRNPFKEILDIEGKIALCFVIALLAITSVALVVFLCMGSIIGTVVSTFALFVEGKTFLWDYAVQTKLPYEEWWD